MSQLFKQYKKLNEQDHILIVILQYNLQESHPNLPIFNCPMIQQNINANGDFGHQNNRFYPNNALRKSKPNKSHENMLGTFVQQENQTAMLRNALAPTTTESNTIMYPRPAAQEYGNNNLTPSNNLRIGPPQKNQIPQITINAVNQQAPQLVPLAQNPPLGQQEEKLPPRITRCPDCNSLLRISYSCTPFTVAWSLFLIIGLTCWVPCVVDACKRSQARCLTCDKVVQVYNPSC